MPELAPVVLTVPPGALVAPGEYAVREGHCYARICDCRSVDLEILSPGTRRPCATFSIEFRKQGPAIVPRSSAEPAMSSYFLEALRAPVVVDALEQHFRTLKKALAQPNHPIHERLDELEGGPSMLDLLGEPEEPVRVQQVGRNDKCPCGSGRKYKKCCLGREAAPVVAAPAAATPAPVPAPALAPRSGARERLNEAIAGLAAPDLEPARRAALEAIVRETLDDPFVLENHPALAPDHALRTAAGAVRRALEAAAKRPVTDDEIALAEVSRRGPLAPFKALVRAIALFHRGADRECREWLAMIDPASPPARTAAVLAYLLDGAAAAPPTPTGRALAAALSGETPELVNALGDVDESFDHCEISELFRDVRRALALCTRDRPELVEEVRQRISVRAIASKFPQGQLPALVRAMGGRSRKDSTFWRLCARMHEAIDLPVVAVMSWERYLVHATDEGRLAGTAGEAAVRLRQVELMTAIPAVMLRGAISAAAREVDLAPMYEEQPPEIAKLAPPPRPAPARGRPKVGAVPYLEPAWLFERLTTLVPDASTFERWLSWTRRSGAAPGALAKVAARWIAAWPLDARPRVVLVESAIERGELAEARRALADLERSGARPDLCTGLRRRIATGALGRALAEKDARGLDAALAELAALPATGAAPVALRAALANRKGAPEDAERHERELARHLGDPRPARLLVRLLAGGLKIDLPEAEPAADAPRGALIEAIGRAQAVATELDQRLPLPPAIFTPMRADLPDRVDAQSADALLHAGQAALGAGNTTLAEAIAALGVRTGGPLLARFLVLRARALPSHLRVRRLDCLAAAATLGRRERDDAAVHEAIALVHENVEAAARNPFSARATPGAREFELDDAAIAAVVKRESRAAAPEAGSGEPKAKTGRRRRLDRYGRQRVETTETPRAEPSLFDRIEMVEAEEWVAPEPAPPRKRGGAKRAPAPETALERVTRVFEQCFGSTRREVGLTEIGDLPGEIGDELLASLEELGKSGDPVPDWVMRTIERVAAEIDGAPAPRSRKSRGKRGKR